MYGDYPVWLRQVLPKASLVFMGGYCNSCAIPLAELLLYVFRGSFGWLPQVLP